MPKRFKTALVCDPVCAQPFGHNVVGLKYFSEKFEQFAERVVAVCARQLPAAVRNAYAFEGGFEFVYHRFIKLASTRPSDLRRLNVAPAHGFVDAAEETATRDMQALFDRHGMDADDLVVFPCVDLYGALGLINVVERLQPANRPRCLLRFIGVMEDAALSKHTGLSALLHRLRQQRAEGSALGLCAETPRYARHLATMLETDVLVVPYPVHTQPEPLVDSDRVFTVALPGSARFDKGYGELQRLFGDVRQRDQDLRIRFVAQSLPPAQALDHSVYTNQLGAIPGVTLLPSSISEEQMNRVYSEADLIIIPYDPAIYQMRGSAVLMESISRTRPVLALEGPAFCDQIRYYGSGAVCNDIPGMAAEILRAASHQDPDLHEALLHTRRHFLRDAEHAFADWVTA